jgi:hypothetical protein
LQADTITLFGWRQPSQLVLRLRIREDWVLILLVLLLVSVSIAALRERFWFLLALTIPFFSVTVIILYKMMRARWCVECQCAMTLVPKQNRPEEKVYYICNACGRSNDAGVRASWYD